eukprot:gnl/TRDRNA2_/TRDRNA2_52627_c0_seq1.p1 gnl/TRDRNA2_/TRDRNA2_52627_c0~~gnl/TRDRNA2_/TRDRNA2_52627_c0_seq1.p1  ORF type:complete len:892 (+),score=147.90 gnl/TRDRNA2_/TRDRNA2_52627_c0_seq1:360-2678(+)
MVLSHCVSRSKWLRTLLAAAGARHARRARGGRGWLWVFWIGLPQLAEGWLYERYGGTRSARIATGDAQQAVRALRLLLSCSGARRKCDKDAAPAELQRCDYCWEWALDGTIWRKKFYCMECSDGWTEYKTTMKAHGEIIESPAPTPPETPRANNSPRSETERWIPGCDPIDFDDKELAEAARRLPTRVRSSANDAASGTHTAAARSATSPLARVVEKSTGLDLSESTTGLAGLESLKVISLVSALRRELGFDISPGDVVGIDSLEELEALCAKRPKTEAQNGKADLEHHGTGKTHWSIFAIPRFWKAPVGWLLRLSEVPDELSMRVACCALVRRHAGLRACPYPAHDEAVAQLINNTAPLLFALKAILGGVADRLVSDAVQGFIAAWPRVEVMPLCMAPVTEMDVSNFEWKRFDTKAELSHEAWLRARSRGFKQPASIGVLILNGGETDEGGDSKMNSHDDAYLHVAVNHAVSDAACIVPIVADLLSLHQAARTVLRKPGITSNIGELATLAAAAAKLPPAPNGLAVHEARLRGALLGTGKDSIDMVHQAFLGQQRPRGYDHYTRLLPGGCRMLEVASASTGIPTDHLLVVAICAAFAAVVSMDTVKLTLIVPMRDGRGEGQTVANLATTRHLSLRVTGRSLLACALDISQRLRRREWSLAEVLDDQTDRLYVNIRGQPTFQGASACIEPVDVLRAQTRYVRNVMEMFVDQESARQWTMSIGIREDLEGVVFSRGLRHALWCLAVDPLAPAVIPASALVPSIPADAVSQATD